jgi:UDP-sulfoquinovose synthase
VIMMSKKVIVLGGDGFVGWPTSLYLSSKGHQVIIVDNLSRRNIDNELECESLTPISPMGDRIKAWKETTGRTIRFVLLDVAKDYDRLVQLFVTERPDTVIHFAEQRAAPYSMKSSAHKRYTVNNNVNATNNVLCAIIDSQVDIHLVHLGTMGVYGYNSVGIKIPEGYLNIEVPLQQTANNGDSPRSSSETTPVSDSERIAMEIYYPPRPGSVYHMTKVLDAQMFEYFNRNDHIRITDLHQGIVWGTNTAETLLDERLVNRFDYDGDYGTVLNRLLMQAAIGYPLTVYGTGGQTRAFIHIRDSVRCIEIAVSNPPSADSRVMIFNQMTETHCVRDLAKLVSGLTSVPTNSLHNPRNEAAENGLEVENAKFLALGLKPTKLDEGLLAEVMDIAKKYSHRCNQERIKPTSLWIGGSAATTTSKKELSAEKVLIPEMVASVGIIPDH